MSYGFKFKNNNQQVIIDDRNVKPWLFNGSYVGYNYVTIDAGSSFGSMTNTLYSNRLKNRTNTEDLWYVFEIRYIAPNNANCLIAFSLPEAAGRDIWYAPGPMGSASLVNAAYLDALIQTSGLGLGPFTPYVSIYGLAPFSWITSASQTELLAALPRPYFFSADAIPAPGTGYGVQVFKEDAKCMFDSNKKHIKLDNFSYAFMEVPNYPGSYGPYIPSTSDKKSYTLTGVPNTNNLAFVLPESRSTFYDSSGVITETRVWYQREGSVIHTINPESYRSLSGNSNLTVNTRYNIGTEVTGSLSDTNLTDSASRHLYTRVLALDVTGFDAPYTPTEFPSAYSFEVSEANNTYEGTLYGAQGYYTVFTLTTFNVANNTQLPYTITGSGITASDIAEALDYNRSFSTPLTNPMSNYITVVNNKAYLYLHFADDGILEGNETLTVSLNNGKASASVIIKERKSYSLSLVSTPVDATINSFNEGSTVYFRVNTTNVPNGTVLSYSFLNSTASAADFTNGLLTGNLTISTIGSSTSGTATGSFTLTNDMLTEYEEHFTIALYDPADPSNFQATLYITINDTSAPTRYDLRYGSQTSGSIFLNEGDSATFTIVGTNVPNGTRVYPAFANTTMTVEDFIVPNSWYDPSVGLTGVVVNNNTATFSFTVKADQLTEGTESLELRLLSTPDNVIGNNILTTWFNGRIYVNDTSVSANYTVTGYVNNVNEGQSFQLDTTVDRNTGQPTYWRITGVDTSDIQSIYELIYYIDSEGTQQSYLNLLPLSLTGSFTYDSTLTKSFYIVIRNDQTLEGTETLGFTLRTGSSDGTIVASKNVTINDTSKPTYYVYDDTPDGTIAEGGTVRWWLQTSGVPNGTLLYWENTGTSTAADFNDAYGNVNYGSVLIMNNGGWFERTLKNDMYTEDTETITMLIRTGGNYGAGSLVFTTNTIYISDTSQNPTASIAPTVSSVNEGGTVRWWISTTNIPDGTLLYWTNTGTTTSADFNDVYGNVNQGSVLIMYGEGWFERTLSNDATTEGSETIIMRLNLGGNNGTLLATSSTVTVNDTSRPAINEVLTITPSSVQYPNGVQVICSGGTPSGTIYWSVDNQSYDQAPLFFDANGYIASAPGAAAQNYGVGTHTLYFYMSDTGHYRQASWTVTAAYPAAGTLLSTFCSGTTKYGSYADGSGGSYNQVIQANSTECGYVAPSGPVTSGYSLQTNDSGNIDTWGTPSATYDGLRCKGANRNSIDMYAQRTFTVDRACTITAYLHVSSEGGFDIGEIYFDNVLYASGSGTYDSPALSGPISAGQHTIRVRYVKDGSVSSGTDAAFIEYSMA